MKIDLTAELVKIESATRIPKSKFAIEVRVNNPQVLDVDPDKIAEAMSKAIVKQTQAFLLAGLDINGNPAKPISSATIKRRAYRFAQAQRGGTGDPDRFKRSELKQQRRNYNKRFKATKAGTFSPVTGPAKGEQLRGVESGMLLNSMVAERSGDGTWRIYVANARGLMDKWGSSPMSRSLGAYNVGAIVKPLKRPIADKVIRGKAGSSAASVSRLLNELSQTFKQASSLANEVGDL